MMIIEFELWLYSDERTILENGVLVGKKISFSKIRIHELIHFCIVFYIEEIFLKEIYKTNTNWHNSESQRAAPVWKGPGLKSHRRYIKVVLCLNFSRIIIPKQSNRHKKSFFIVYHYWLTDHDTTWHSDADA